MLGITLPPLKSFLDQSEVDEYVLETEKIAEETFDEETAIELYKHVSRLRSVEDLYFVPAIVLSWEEMALSFIESEFAVFECVYYEQLCQIHKRGFKAFQNLEQHVLDGRVPEEALFGMIHGFNIDVYSFNKYCKKYHQEVLDYYICTDNNLQQKYINWAEGKEHKEES